MATLGRMVLAKISKRYIRPRLSEKSQKNMEALGSFLTNNKRFSIPLVFAYAFLPIPSNQIFIAAGLSGVGVELISFSFMMGRLVSYTFWVKMADHMTDRVNGAFMGDALSVRNIILEVVGVFLLILIMKIPWSKWITVKNEAKVDGE
jgi:uncharacterized membrane protein YdjX (TVP38/TMEM64 family)